MAGLLHLQNIFPTGYHKGESLGTALDYSGESVEVEGINPVTNLPVTSSNASGNQGFSTEQGTFINEYDYYQSLPNTGFSTEHGTFTSEDDYYDIMPNTGFSTADGTFINEDDYHQRMPNQGFSIGENVFANEGEYQRSLMEPGYYEGDNLETAPMQVTAPPGVDNKVPGNNVPGQTGGWYPGKYLGKGLGLLGGWIEGNDIFDRMSQGLDRWGSDWTPGKFFKNLNKKSQKNNSAEEVSKLLSHINDFRDIDESLNYQRYLEAINQENNNLANNLLNNAYNNENNRSGMYS